MIQCTKLFWTILHHIFFLPRGCISYWSLKITKSMKWYTINKLILNPMNFDAKQGNSFLNCNIIFIILVWTFDPTHTFLLPLHLLFIHLKCEHFDKSELKYKLISFFFFFFLSRFSVCMLPVFLFLQIPECGMCQSFVHFYADGLAVWI